uniref:receptor kinase-like protein Xa21 n=1 Tax=Erigeron canadensis TaxID=72917 RepID=UPI001CB92B13|nr:receptor kinase-like protein Xa21 [Erigeron canadensis]
MSATKWLPFFFVTLVLVATFSTVAAQNRTIPVSGTNTVDREALLAIKSMINDPRGLMSSWNNSSVDFCQWQGVICGLRHQRVIALNLSSGGLLGSLSPFIGNLSFLRAIRAHNNSLSGDIPSQLGRLFRLQELRLYNNSFTGSIPDAITNCTNLQYLHVGYNNLVGKIPDRIGSLSMLSLLIVHENSLQGGIPPFIGNLTLLETVSFFNCRLGGRTPDVFQRLSNLRRYSMAGNDLVGTVPPSLYNLSSLEELYIDDNRLTGRLPTNINTTLPKIGTLSFPRNQFTGPLPPSILSSPTLLVIDVAQNNLSGKLVINPRNTCQLTRVSLSWNNFGNEEDDEMKFIDGLSICKNLDVLLLSNTQMRGFLPDSLGNLSTSLSQLDLASNAFSGSLPSSVGGLSGLTSLDVSNNQLTGTLPMTIGNLRNIRRLNLKNNSFSGSIPSSIGNLSLMIELHLGLNKLNGSIPSDLGNAKRLIELNLDRNNLTGAIPRKLFELTSLSIILNLGSNQLSGQLPTQIGNLKGLTEIILANNRLSGELPSSLGSCSSLENLNISNNFFSGSLPSSLGSLRALENVDVSHNNFTGQIPTYLETIPLASLNMSFNRFQGVVPKKGVFSNAGSVSIVGNGQLCGGVIELYLPKCSSNKRKNNLSLAVILVISIVPALLCVALVLLLFMCCRRKREVESDPPETRSGESLIQVSYEALYKATDGFSTKNLIGEGSFSSVYKGCLDDGVILAIKVLNLHRQGGSKSFISECEALRNARHRNLIKVITCCSGIDFHGNEFKAIVYEFMPNGNLDQWLHNVQNELPRLSLLQRVCIALDVAYALNYLHHHAAKTIVHCDLKPSNILLDKDLVAHVGDFGLAKILQSEYHQNRQHSSSVGIRGSIGYAAPEYGVGSKVSRSGDMYSYGILLLEMITNKKPIDAMFVEGVSLHSYAKKAMGDGSLGIIDPMLINNDGNLSKRTNKEGAIGHMNNEACLRLLLEIGVSCSMERPQYRMDTATVIQELQLIKDAILGDSNVSINFV